MTIIQDMLEKYDCRNATDYRNALKEIIQEVALCDIALYVATVAISWSKKATR